MITDNLLARFALVNLTFEAKGLDTYLKTKERLLYIKDERSLSILEHNIREEIGHVRIGLKWFQYICAKRGISAVDEFHRLFRMYYKGDLKGPFNVEFRELAGFSSEWYLPISS